MSGVRKRRVASAPSASGARSRGLGVLEVLTAIAVLSIVVLPLLGLIVGSLRSVAGAHQRLVIELRARRHLCEAVTTTFDALAATAGTTLPILLGEPADQAGYGEHVQGLEEATQAREVEPGLLEVTTTILWTDRGARGRRRQTVATLLVVRPTLSLEARHPIQEAAVW